MRRLLLTALLFVVCGAYAQVDASMPAALKYSITPLETVDQLVIAAPSDMKSVRDEDLKRASEGRPPRYAIAHPVSITPEDAGTWETLEDGTRVWRLRISAPGAKSINLGFGAYRMPEGGQLLIYSSDYAKRIRAFTAKDNERHGELWTPLVQAEEIVVELVLPAKYSGDLDLELAQVGYGYRELGAPDPTDKAGACNVDVVCSEGDDWRTEIASVAVISTGGATFCTGFMVNNTAADRTPYFMTAHHCEIGASEAPSVIAFWNYQTSTCGGARDGQFDQFNTGAELIATYSASDFTLLRLDDDPEPEFGVSFAGWDRSSGNFPGAIAIHHPSGDEKAISFEFDSTTTTAYLVDTPSANGDHIRIDDWDVGTTEPGSSGSPLFNPDGRVVGQLHGGYAACGNDLPDWYGRLSVSWNGGGTAGSRLRDWLDPLGSGAMTTDTISGTGLGVEPGGDTVHTGPIGGPFTNDPVVYRLSNESGSALDYQVRLTNNFGVLLNGGTTPITGTLQPGGSRNITASLGAPIAALPAGLYLEVIEFENLTNASTARREHTIQVGLREVTVSASDTPRAIQDFQTAVSTINVQDSGCIVDANVEVDIAHTWIGDLIVDLVSPGGLPVRLHNRSGGSSDDIVALYDDDGLQPEGPGVLAAFNQEGISGNWSLRVADNAGGDTGSIEDWSIDFVLLDDDCPTRQTVLNFPLSGDPGWARTGLWDYGTPTGGVGEAGFPDPTSGYTGSAVYGYNLSGNYENNLPAQYLTTDAFDLAGFSNTYLTFWRWLNVDSSTFDTAAIEVSNDGANWHRVYESLVFAIDPQWTRLGYDISSIADNRDGVYIRWVMGPTNSEVRLTGWNIDDIQILGVDDPVLDFYSRVQDVYIAYYGRPADPLGRRFWAEQLNSVGGNLNAIIDAFGTSQEFNDEYGDLTNGQLIDTVYDQMFCRAPDPAGREFYLGLLDRGERTLATITLNILDGAQNEDAQAIENKLMVAAYFTNRIEDLGLEYGADDIAAARSVLAPVCADPSTVADGIARADQVLSEL